MHLVLLGYRGCGKSTIAKILSHTLSMPSIDTDEQVRMHFAGRSVADIWASEGEPVFRAMECTVTRELLSATQPSVIALGGGTPMQQDAYEALISLPCHKVYLRATAKTLAKHIGTDTTNRPALTSAGVNGEIQHVLQQRDPVYSKLADQIIDIDNSSADQVSHIICNTWNNLRSE